VPLLELETSSVELQRRVKPALDKVVRFFLINDAEPRRSAESWWGAVSSRRRTNALRIAMSMWIARSLPRTLESNRNPCSVNARGVFPVLSAAGV
jgi:hypothetical protein